MKNTKAGLCILVLVVSFVTFMPPYVKLAYADVNVAVYPSTIVAGLGNSFTVNITTSNVNNLYGWEFKLNWTTSYLDVNKVTEGPFLKGGGNTFFTNLINSTAGHLIADCTLLGQVPGVNGSGTLAAITFSVKATGHSILDLYNATLLDDSPFSLSIPCQTSGGYWSSSGFQHDVSITSTSFAPLSVLPGQIVDINVTASNHGTFAETFNVTTFINSQVLGKQTVALDSGNSMILPFIWDTTGYGKGEYSVSASADIVLGETNIGDNNLTASQVIVVLTATHDVAVTGVRPSKIVVGQGFCMFINTTVRDFGIYDEIFNTTTFANSTAIRTDNITLASGQGAVLTFVWNCSGFLLGNYTLWAYASPVNGETSIGDNNYTYGQVIVAKKGDITGPYRLPDGKVDIIDVSAVARSFGTKPGDKWFNPEADVTGILRGLPDNVIDIRDVSTIAKYFGT